MIDRIPTNGSAISVMTKLVTAMSGKISGHLRCCAPSRSNVR